jgi:hypothetical protein
VAEVWDPVTGKRKLLNCVKSGDTGVSLLMNFPPCGSRFVIFHNDTAVGNGAIKASDSANNTALDITGSPVANITGPWTVSFSTNWAGPASAEFASLVSWTEHPEPGIKFYSGTATYTKTFELPPQSPDAKSQTLFLDLGSVRELAEVKVNGQSCGITWTPPFRVDITKAVKPGANKLEVEVVNFWPNRVIGDASLPAEQRFTRTNIRKLTKDTPLMPSGLLGPVRIWEQR